MRRILDLCAGSGAWSEPYAEFPGYEVIRVTLPQDVRLLENVGPVHGILAAPPCTVFSNAGAWVKRSDDELRDALSVADACLRFVAICRPKWWALENPVGKLAKFYGEPRMWFDPCDYGDPYTKKTGLWGDFTIPEKNRIAPFGGSYAHRFCGKDKAKRAITPPGFATAFFWANS
jgi:hypothetical protein